MSPDSISLLLLLVGAGIGLLTSTIGVGASLVAVPALLLLLPLMEVPASVAPAMAVGTALAVSVCTAGFTAYTHWRLQNLQDPLSRDNLTLIAAAGCGAFIGSSFASRAPAAVAITIMVAAQAAMGYLILRGRSTLVSSEGTSPPAGEISGPHLSPAALGSFGVLTSIGAGGTLIAPYLTLKGIQHRQAVGLAAWLSVLIGGTALLVYAAANTAAAVEGAVGAVHLRAAVLLAAGSLIAIHFGASLATQVNQILLRRLLGLALVASSARLAWTLVLG